jgi:outer membrane protein assembly factor BamE (lipoprotein component of BamABCDE complex)
MKTSTIFFLVAAALAALWGAGCSTPQTRIQRNPEVFSRLTSEEQTMVRNGQIGLGFTSEMVRLALGDPDYIDIRTDKTGTSEIWTYTSSETMDEMGFYNGWYHHSPWGWGGPFFPYPLFAGRGYRREWVDFRVVFKDGKAVSVEQRRE